MSYKETVAEIFARHKPFTDRMIEAGIERNRKGNAKITVTDENGTPIQGAKIKAVQKSHEFRFGANLLMLDEFETDEKNEKYKKYFSDLFNMATLPFYWNTLEPERGKPRYAKDSPKVYRRPAIDLCMEFCEEYGIEPSLFVEMKALMGDSSDNIPGVSGIGKKTAEALAARTALKKLKANKDGITN